MLQVIRCLGEHALPAFAIGVAALMLGVSLVWWAMRRWTVPLAADAPLPVGLLLLRIGLGLGLVVGAAALFAELAEGLGAREELGDIDATFMEAMLGNVPIAALRVFASVTKLGDTSTLTVIGVAVAAALWWRRERFLALAWSSALLGNALINTALKHVFERVRPVHDDGLVLAQGWSFPSGHASGAVVCYGMLAYLAVRWLPVALHLPVMLFAAALALTIGSSRVFLQVHYASDVVAGFASGTAWLTVCIFNIEITRWYRGVRPR